jgi:phosphoglycerate dehydrogenase-like enzyme
LLDDGTELQDGNIMTNLRVAFTNVFFRPDGTPAFKGYDISPLKARRNIEIKVLPQAPVISAADLADIDVLVTSTGEAKVNGDSLTRGGRLALIARAGAGYDDVDVSACTADHVAVAIASDAVRRPTAVGTLTLMLAVATRLIDKHNISLKGPREWSRLEDYAGIDLTGKTLGLVGLGSIGGEVARLVAPLQMRIIAHDPMVKPDAAAALGAELVGLETLLRQADVVSLHVPLTEATRHLINAERLGLMKSSAFLINAARGKVIDQKALVECLRARRIAGAGLDVMEKEPPDEDDPLLKLDNVVLSAHAIAWTDNLNARLADTNIKAIVAVAEGRDPAGVVNSEVLGTKIWREKLSRLRSISAQP